MISVFSSPVISGGRTRAAGRGWWASARRLNEVPEDDLPFRRWFYAQTWCYSGEQLGKQIDFQPARRCWQDTMAALVALGPQPV